MAKSTCCRSSSWNRPSHTRQGTGQPDSKQLDNSTEKSKNFRLKRRAVLIVSNDEDIDKGAL
jgi:hypothetical protein